MSNYVFVIRHRQATWVTSPSCSSTVTSSQKIGTYTGRLLCRASGRFDISMTNGRVAGISYKYCKPIHQKDGYSYGV